MSSSKTDGNLMGHIRVSIREGVERTGELFQRVINSFSKVFVQMEIRSFLFLLDNFDVMLSLTEPFISFSPDIHNVFSWICTLSELQVVLKFIMFVEIVNI